MSAQCLCVAFAARRHISGSAHHPLDPDITTHSPTHIITPQELLSERARLQQEVNSLKASTAAEASSSKAELTAQREKLEQQQASLAARAEAVSAGACVCMCRALAERACLMPAALWRTHSPRAALLSSAGEAVLKAEKLELQLQTRKQAADVEMAQSSLQQQAASLVRLLSCLSLCARQHKCQRYTCASACTSCVTRCLTTTPSHTRTPRRRPSVLSLRR